MQPIVCTGCGIEGCAPGGWVAPRAAGDRILWIPAFDEMGDDFGRRERAPPSYVSTRGVPTFADAAATALAEAVAAAALDAIEPLRSRELALLLQWLAPAEVLGATPPPAVRAADLLAEASGERERRSSALADLLDGARADVPVSFRPLRTGDELVTFFLDAPGHVEWSPLVLVGGEPALHLDGLVATLEP